MGSKTMRRQRNYPQTDERRQRANAYLRQYRAEHPEKVRQWRDAYILRRAARLMAEQRAGADGGDFDAGA